MGLFGKKKVEEEEEIVLSKDKLVFVKIDNDDAKAAELVDEISDSIPVIINFEDLDPTAANKMLAFFAGATYALNGKSVEINKKTFLFAKKEEFIDGSLYDFIENIPKK